MADLRIDLALDNYHDAELPDESDEE